MGYSVHYYDLVLVAIISSLGVGGAVGYVFPVPMTTAVSLFGVVGIGLVGHALFINGPVDDVEELTEEVEPEEVPGVPVFAQTGE